MIEEITPFLSKVTPGAVGIWTLLAAFLIAWWKGLPSVIEAIANRQSKIEERLGAEMDAMSKRWEERIALADKSHDECMKGQEVLRQRINAQDSVIAQQNATIANQARTLSEQTQTITDLNAQVAGMSANARQATMSVLRAIPNDDSMSPQMRDMKRKLDNL